MAISEPMLSQERGYDQHVSSAEIVNFISDYEKELKNDSSITFSLEPLSRGNS